MGFRDKNKTKVPVCPRPPPPKPQYPLIKETAFYDQIGGSLGGGYRREGPFAISLAKDSACGSQEMWREWPLWLWAADVRLLRTPYSWELNPARGCWVEPAEPSPWPPTPIHS